MESRTKIDIQSQKSQNRILWIDNVKGVLIFLVVFGHLIPGINSQPFKISHYLIYAIHMPMFMLVSGYLSKKPSSMGKILKNYIIPYVVFDLLFALYLIIYHKGRGISSLNFFFPKFVYWYILCLGLMKIIIRPQKPLLLLMFICIGGGTTILSPLFVSEGTWRFLSWGRLALLSFVFIAGIIITPKVCDFFIKRKLLAVTLGLICLAGELIILKEGIVSSSWATHDYPNTIKESVIKYLFFIFTIGFFFSLISVLDKHNGFLTKWGKNSILIYLLHPYTNILVSVIISKTGYKLNYVLYIALLITAVLICSFFSMDIWKRIYDAFINYIARMLKITK